MIAAMTVIGFDWHRALLYAALAYVPLAILFTLAMNTTNWAADQLTHGVAALRRHNSSRGSVSPDTARACRCRFEPRPGSRQHRSHGPPGIPKSVHSLKGS